MFFTATSRVYSSFLLLSISPPCPVTHPCHLQAVVETQEQGMGQGCLPGHGVRAGSSTLRAPWPGRFKEQLVGYDSTLNMETFQRISEQQLYVSNSNQINSPQLTQVTYI